MTTIENELFQRPAHYWLRRAERQKQSGDLIRAAVLERHAVRAEPHSDAARMSYAFTLRQLHCYEASNREAFAALAQDPTRTAMFGLIGQNMFSLGMRQSGLDAMNLYAADPPAVPPQWQDEAYDMADAYDHPALYPKRRARLKGLLAIAMRRIAKEDMEGASRALQRAMRKPFHAPNAQRELALAACFQRLGDKALCMQHLHTALKLKPTDARLRLSAIMLFSAIGAKAQARKLLVKAVRSAHSPLLQLLTLTVCDDMKMPQMALYMLRRAHGRNASRFPVCYDLSVCLARLGRLEEALQYIHICREIDPADVEGEILFARLTALSETDPTPAQVKKAARSFGWHGMLIQQELTDCISPIDPLIHQGPQAFADALLSDVGLCRRFLLLLTLQAEWPAVLLASLVSAMPAENLIPLCREVLLQHPASTPGKRCAVAILHRLGVKPPYTAWMDDRIALMDPTRTPEGSPTFVQRVLTLRIRQAQKLAGRGVIPWAMGIISRMNKAQRRSLLSDRCRVWPLAMAVCWRSHQGMKPLRVNQSLFNAMRAAAFRQALDTLHQLERRKDPT